jgi:hypothetical protein
VSVNVAPTGMRAPPAVLGQTGTDWEEVEVLEDVVVELVVEVDELGEVEDDEVLVVEEELEVDEAT